MAKRNLTTTVPSVKFEYVRKGANGLELVQCTGKRQTVTPVKITTTIGKRKQLIIGIEPRFINGELRVF